MPQIYTYSEQETRRLGERLGGHLRAGDVVLLSGELGAGKSVLARGIASGMGVTGPMPSPTFTLMTVSQGAACPLYHLDLYRLESAEALWACGLEEYLGGDGVAVVEWPERAMEALPARRLALSLAYSHGGDAREIRATAQGGFPAEIAKMFIKNGGMP